MSEQSPSDRRQLDIERLFSQVRMLLEELALAEKYLFPKDDEMIWLVHQIKTMRVIKTGDAKDSEIDPSLYEKRVAGEIERGIIGKVRKALHDSKDTVYVDRLLTALRLVNSNKRVRRDLAKNATGAILYLTILFRQQHGYRPTWEKAVEILESYRRDGLRQPSGNPPDPLSEKTLHRAKENLRALFP
jgi:hypothetical protein